MTSISKNSTMTDVSFTDKERQRYTIQKEKAKFSSPEEEYTWAATQSKICTKCGIDKDLNQYNGNTAGADGFDRDGYRLRRPECAICTKKEALGKEEAKIIAKEQGIPYKAPEGTRCAVCNCLPRKGNGLVFDHCHIKKVFRGYCCNACNRSMGVLGDDIPGLLKAINYLLLHDPQTIVQLQDRTLQLQTPIPSSMYVADDKKQPVTTNDSIEE